MLVRWVVRTNKCTQYTHISKLHRQMRIKYLYKVLIIQDSNININWLSLGTKIRGDQVIFSVFGICINYLTLNIMLDYFNYSYL